MNNQLMTIDVSYSNKSSNPIVTFGRISGNKSYRIKSHIRLNRIQYMIDQLESIDSTQSYLDFGGLTINIFRGRV